MHKNLGPYNYFLNETGPIPYYGKMSSLSLYPQIRILHMQITQNWTSSTNFNMRKDATAMKTWLLSLPKALLHIYRPWEHMCSTSKAVKLPLHGEYLCPDTISRVCKQNEASEDQTFHFWKILPIDNKGLGIHACLY